MSKEPKFSIIFLIMLIGMSNLVFAIDCTKTKLNNIEKIICDNESLKIQDKKYNERYQQILKELPNNEQEIFKNSVKNLLKARNDCENLYGLLSNAKKTIDLGVIDKEIYPINYINYQTGCIVAWYNTMEFAMNVYLKHKDLFILPTYDTYFSTFKALILQTKKYPLSIDIEIKNEKMAKKFKVAIDSARYTTNKFTLFFPKASKPFASIYEGYYFYNAGTPHGNGTNNLKFLFMDKNQNDNLKLNQIQSGSYKCSIPIEKPIILNNQIYLPENVSFTKIFNRSLGKYSQYHCYVCTGEYRPDCMLKLKPLNMKEKEAYLLFTNEYFDYLHGFEIKSENGPKKIPYNSECILKS